MIQCENHPDRLATVELDWGDDSLDACADCILPELGRLTETLIDMYLGEPTITITLHRNPHPPVPGAELVTCAGCGHPLSADDDTASSDAPGDPTGLTLWHVNCPLPAGLTWGDDGTLVWQ